MSFLKQPTTALAVAACALAGAIATPLSASAAGGGTMHVGDGESIQAAVDAAGPGTKIIVRGDHVENVWIDKSGIELVGKDGATITQPSSDDTTFAPCIFFTPNGESTTICVYPRTEEFPVPPEQQLSGVSITGLTVENPTWDAIGVYASNDVRVSRNTAGGSGCSGIFLLFVEDFQVDRNTVTDALGDCNGIDVAASSRGEVTRNVSNDGGLNGIAINDSSDVVVSRNSTSGNCQGIGVFDNPDPSDLPAADVSITRNTANGNNTVCYPFNGPDDPEEFLVPVGGAGIIVAGAIRPVIERNTTNDNVVEGFSVTAAGILVTDFPGELPGEVFAYTTDARVDRNTAFGNSSAAGPVDLWVAATNQPSSVSHNSCGSSTPVAAWCSG